jgi:hypothetical protein
MPRIALYSLTVLALAACGGGSNANAEKAAADSAGVPNTQNGALNTTGPVGDSLSSAAAGATVSPGATDTTARTSGDSTGDTTGRATRPPRSPQR